MDEPEIEGIPHFSGNSPACLGMVQFVCCGMQGLMERLDNVYFIEKQKKAAAAERKQKSLSLPKRSKKKLALPPRLALTPLLTLKYKKLPRDMSLLIRPKEPDGWLIRTLPGLNRGTVKMGTR